MESPRSPVDSSWKTTPNRKYEVKIEEQPNLDPRPGTSMENEEQQ